MINVYEYTNSDYEHLIKQPVKLYKFKIELLSHWEYTLDEIVQDISSSSAGQITVNREQGLRRSCSFTLTDIKQEYIPTENSKFWYNRKFKLFTGIYDRDNDKTYWYSQGVFITQNAKAEHNLVTINAVDKFGLFDGTLNTQMCQTTYKVEKGTIIGNFIRDTLALDMGNGIPADPIIPIIDTEIENKKIKADIVLNAGQYIGDFFTEIATSFGCDVYYDRQGHFKLTRKFNDDISTYYIYKGVSWEFNSEEINFISPNVDYQYDGINTVTISSNNTEGIVYTYTSINDNPNSPVSVSKIGTRYDKTNPVTYISMGSSQSDDTCRQYGEYLLLKNACMTVNINFNCPILPHLDVDDTIYIKDKYLNFQRDKFLIQSLTIPLNNSEMSVSVVNVQWLPVNLFNFKKG